MDLFGSFDCHSVNGQNRVFHKRRANEMKELNGGTPPRVQIAGDCRPASVSGRPGSDTENRETVGKTNWAMPSGKGEFKKERAGCHGSRFREVEAAQRVCDWGAASPARAPFRMHATPFRLVLTSHFASPTRQYAP